MDPSEQDTRTLAQRLTEEGADGGCMVELGWRGFVMACNLKDAPPIQLEEMRRAFFAGAMHLFASVLNFLEPGTEPTEKDMNRMTLLSDELNRFQKEFQAHLKSKTKTEN